jgi:hypothetical protein
MGVSMYAHRAMFDFVDVGRWGGGADVFWFDRQNIL